jgi:hypothetical protein
VPTQQDIPRLLALRETRRRGGLARNQNAALTEIERRFQQIAEPAAAMATGMLAEPVSGIVGMAALPFGADVAANAVRNTQQGLTYQPRTEAGQQGMQALQGFMQPIAETVSRQTDIASKVLAGNAGFDVNTPGGQFLTGMLPALAASAPGFTAARAIPGRRLEMGDIGAGGVGSRQRGMFAGVRAKTADFDALDTAKNMKGQGATRDQIWNETGWFEDVDGSWKFEIDDSATRSKPFNEMGWAAGKDLQTGNSAVGPVSDFFEAKELESAYSGLIDFGDADRRAAMVVKPNMGASGSFDPDSNTFEVGLDGSGINRSVALHELQHAVQGREGFAEGGSPASFLSDTLTGELSDLKSTAMQSFRDGKISADQFYAIDELTPQEYAFKKYQRLAGEAEARNVETRRDFTPQQRRDSTPWSTLDVPESELIVRRGAVGGVVAAADNSSKIRRLYHASNVEFDKFDPARVGDRMTALGLGHYLTPNKVKANQYGSKLMEFDVDTKDVLDFSNLTPVQRGEISAELLKQVPTDRLAGFMQPTYKVLSPDDAGDRAFTKLQKQTDSYYHDRAKAIMLDGQEVPENIAQDMGIKPGDIVVRYVDSSKAGLENATPENILALMQEFDQTIPKKLGYKGASYGDEFAIYDPDLAVKVK